MIGILLAAGRGTRMKSETPKVLFEINGQPMCMGPLKALMETCTKVVVVIGYRGAEVKDRIVQEAHKHWDSQTVSQKISFQTQEPPRGTGDAVATALRGLESQMNDNIFLVVNGDLPLVRAKTLQKLILKAKKENSDSLCLSMFTSRPQGLGRIIRSEMGHFLGIREEKDATADEKKINEVNGGIYFFRGSFLSANIKNLKTDNKQNEFYLTDLLGKDKNKSARTDCVSLKYPWDLMGVNNTWELAFARKIAQTRLQKKMSEELGVDFKNPDTIRVTSTTTFEGECSVGPGVVFEGVCKIGPRVVIEGQCLIRDSVIHSDAHILWGSVLENSEVGSKSSVGPLAHLRPGSKTESDVKIGNFVELKKTVMKKGSKAAHLSYLGDAEIGEEANIGCGTITCNYDGFGKHKTVVGKGAFIGSDTQLVAPVVVGENAYVASGTTVTEDVPSGALAIARPDMVIKAGYAKKLA